MALTNRIDESRRFTSPSARLIYRLLWTLKDSFHVYAPQFLDSIPLQHIVRIVVPSIVVRSRDNLRTVIAKMILAAMVVISQDYRPA